MAGHHHHHYLISITTLCRELSASSSTTQVISKSFNYSTTFRTFCGKIQSLHCWRGFNLKIDSTRCTQKRTLTILAYTSGEGRGSPAAAVNPLTGSIRLNRLPWNTPQIDISFSAQKNCSHFLITTNDQPTHCVGVNLNRINSIKNKFMALLQFLGYCCGT